MEPASANRTHCVEGSWKAQIIDDLKPQEGDGLGDLALDPQDGQRSLRSSFKGVATI
jgi:nicotinamidase-related amidase